MSAPTLKPLCSDPQIEIEVRERMSVKDRETIESLKRELGTAFLDRLDLIEVITILHAADPNRPDCIHCDGKGEKVEEVGDPGGPCDLDQPTHAEMIECEGCHGTKKDWKWTPEVRA